jgi:hypothetical protein
MKISQKIEKRIASIATGTTFRYEDLDIEASEYGAATKSIGRFVDKGTLQRASKGVFYKPRQTVFGLVKPSDYELLKPYLFKNNKRVAYITGIQLYNQMGLTTQMPFTIEISGKSRLKITKVGNLKVKSIKNFIEVTDNNYQLLGILDTFKGFDTIPDIDRTTAIKLLINNLKKLTPQQTQELVMYALKYPPRVRAFVGSVLENIDETLDLINLKKSINPLSKYKVGITSILLPNANNWNLK